MVVHFLVTGFGPFCGVDANPTEVLIDWLRGHPVLSQGFCTVPGGDSTHGPTLAAGEPHGAVTSCKCKYSVNRCVVLEVSADAVDEWMRQQDFKQLLQQANQQNPVMLLHLGVDTQRTCFNLELQAYNNATFRCPDQAGWQPKGCCIEKDHHLGLDSVRVTALPLHKLAHKLRQAGFDCLVSTDAGRFVCNYTYYRSLQLAAQLQHHSKDDQQQLAQHAHAVRSHVPAAVNAAASGTTAAVAVIDRPSSSAGNSGDVDLDLHLGGKRAANTPSACSESNGNGRRNGGGSGSPAIPKPTSELGVADGACYSLFVHFPTFTSISLHKQKSFLLHLLQLITETLQSRIAV